MNGPDFITADGQTLLLAWQRLRPAAEVVAAIPAPGELELPRDAAAGGSTVSDDFTVGEGFDRRRLRKRPSTDSAKRPRLFVASGEVKTDPSFLFGGRSIDSMGGDQPVSADDEDERVIRSLPLDRPWLATELARFERLACEILEAHAYPVGVDWPLWRVIGDDLCWADRPMVVGRLEGEAKKVSLMDMGSLALEIGPLAARWPGGSPFRWALTVYRLARHYRRTMAELVAAGCPAAPLEAIFQAAFELGSAMTEDTFRRLYDGELRGGHVIKQAQSRAGQTRGQQVRAEMMDLWGTEGLQVAKECRVSDPTIGKLGIAKEIFKQVIEPKRAVVKDGLLPTDESNILRIIQGWEGDDKCELPKRIVPPKKARKT